MHGLCALHVGKPGHVSCLYSVHSMATIWIIKANQCIFRTSKKNEYTNYAREREASPFKFGRYLSEMMRYILPKKLQ